MNYNYFVDLSSWFFIIFFLGTAISSMIENILDYLNNRKTDINTKTKEIHKLHPLFKKLYSLPKIKKSIEYHKEHQQLSDLNSFLTSGFSSMFFLFGITPFIFHMIYNFTNGNIPLTYILITSLATVFSNIIDIPFSLYSTFNIENRYGFNNSSKSLFFIDLIKSVILNIIFTSAIILGFNYLLTSFGKFDNIHICMLVGIGVLFGYFMEFLGSTVLIRLFNKLTPLKDKKLTQKITNLFKKCGYKRVPKLFVMDSSKRSGHGNAFIGGIGPSKKIVLFDTLLKKHTTDEILSILAHEIGHDKNHDLIKGRIYSILKTLLFTFLVFTFIYDIRLYHAFGFNFITEENIVQFSLLGFSLMNMVIAPLKNILTTPLESAISRKAEYRADKYSSQHTSSKSMISSLIRLSSDNLSDLFPHKLFETWYYDHPSIVNRVKALMPKQSKNKKTNTKKQS